MSLFSRKPIDVLITESQAEGKGTLKKTLGPVKLITLGVGVIVGAGLFSITGNVAADYAGPAITLSFIIAALGCCFAGLCYAEFASMLPIAGSAYTYSYATMGEFIAWIIGWDLVLEYTVAAATVSISWSMYLNKMLQAIGIYLPPELMACPWDGGIINLPAMLIIFIMSMILIRGTENSSLVNTIIVIMKVGIIIIFILFGWKYINSDNYIPYIPKNTGTFGEYGISGIIRGAAIVFFAFLGFDAVSTAAQETKNPERNMPIGILGSLIVCTILYMLFGYVMTGVAHYTEFKGQDGIAPVSVAISHMGYVANDGTFVLAYPWMNKLIPLAIIAGYTSVILVLLMAQSRVFYSMSKDKLLPKLFSVVHPKFRTPFKSNLLFMVVIGLLAGLVPARVAGEMTSIGTLLAFTIVCAGILIMRKKMPDLPRSFKVPFGSVIPILGIATCLFLMVFLPFDTWIRLLVWMIIGLDIYAYYGLKHSDLNKEKLSSKGQSILNLSSISISVILVVISIWHQTSIGWNESLILTIFALAVGILHLIIFGVRQLKN